MAEPVLSAADFLRWAEDGCSPPTGAGRYMTEDVVTASPHMPLPELAQMMVDAHIHRIVVVDEESRPIGIVSSTDILAAMARAAREHSEL